MSTIDGITPFRLLRDPYPAGLHASPGSSEGLLTGVGGALQAPLQDGSPTPWTRQWNVTLQRELPWRVAAEVSYVGTAGHDLQTNTESGLNLNQLDPQYLALGSALNQTVPNPFFGIVNSGILVSPTDQPRPVAAAVSAVHRHHPAAEHRRRPRSITRCS